MTKPVAATTITTGAVATVAGLLVLAAVAAAAASAAETWRYVLLLRGRTQVLDASTVRVSDAAVIWSGMAAPVLGIAAFLAAAALVEALYRAAAHRADRAPARSSGAVTRRLIVPGWNVYGAGQVLLEIAGNLRTATGHRGSTDRLIPVWWALWALNQLLLAVGMVMTFLSSEQALANNVELRLILDAVAALTAIGALAIIVSMGRTLSGRRRMRYASWHIAAVS